MPIPPASILSLSKLPRLLLSLLGVSLIFGQNLAIAQVATSNTAKETPEVSKPICPRDLESAIEAIIERPQLARSRWGILIQPLATTETLYAREASRYFIPASNAKLLTTAATLHQLGSWFRIQTSVYGTGTLPNLTSLRVAGRGDPSLNNADLSDLAQQLKRQGIHQVEQLIVDDGYFQEAAVNPTWEWSDLHFSYAVAVNSLILNQNAVELTLSPQQLGEALELSWSDQIAAKQWQVRNNSLTAEALTPNSAAVTGILGQPQLQITGKLAVDAESNSYFLAIPDPAKYFLERFQNVLRAEGIEVVRASLASNYVASGERELAKVESPPLAVLLVATNQESNNLYAEALLRTLHTTQQGKLSPEDPLKAALANLGVDPTSYLLADGSGLSRHNLVTPEAIAQTLKLIAQTPQAAVYRASLPVAGISGTLSSRFSNTAAQGNLRAKTGTLSGVSALSGYLDVPTYQPLVFSIMVNQSEQSSTNLRHAIDEIVLLLTRLRTCKVS
ncbi:D-alanyl-D-alanine carboxypeptidase/D-alanyl-D-alanine endopeptidase [Lyngbya aestuarii]|uniref:D-alanyl-D-alanine carboxypeptidase/D-alanyl-D-alanine endopeptidase n=1 Tax=Lyngbya aestuarii TaxID=118322 RepID=UPI00403E22A4